MPVEGQRGTAKDGTPVVFRNGRVVPDVGAPRQGAAPPQIMLPGAITTAKLQPDIDQTKASANSANATAAKTRQQIEQDARKEIEDNRAAAAARQSAVEAAKTLGEFADFGLSHINNNFPGGTTGWNGLFTAVPDSRQKEMKNHLDAAGANVAIAALQKMRRENPTGGALGNVSDKDMGLLKAIQGPLDQTDTASLRETLGRLKYLQLKVQGVLPRDMDHGTYVMLQRVGRDPAATGVLPPSRFGDGGAAGAPASALPTTERVAPKRPVDDYFSGL